MASLKDTFAKGLTTINVKTSNFMEESKCRTYMTTLEGEIKELKLSIGEKSYEAWCKDADCTDEITALYEKIKEKNDEIELQKEKIQKLAEEEQQILGSASQTAQAQESVGNVFCSQCGTANAANFKFCAKCGAPLK